MARIKQLYDNAWAITEPGKFSSAKMYLLAGSDRAVLIDSSYGGLDLEKLVRTLYKGPVMILNTHGHLDHIGGNRFFPSYLHEKDTELYRRHSDPGFLKKWKLPVFPRAEVHSLDFDAVDIGGGVLEVIETPGHTQGSVSIP